MLGLPHSEGRTSHMVLRSALAHRLQTHVWIRGSASNHYLQTPARLRLQFSSVARSTSFCVLFAALSLTEVTDRDRTRSNPFTTGGRKLPNRQSKQQSTDRLPDYAFRLAAAPRLHQNQRYPSDTHAKHEIHHRRHGQNHRGPCRGI